jgi:hypothetical protein
VSIAKWEQDFAPPSIGAYLRFLLAHAALAFPTGLREEQARARQHTDVTGCVQDHWDPPVKIKVSMAAGILCGECHARFRSYGVSETHLAAVERVLSLVRQEAIGRSLTIKHKSAFVIIKYDEENNAAFDKGIVPGLNAVGLKADRADRVHTATNVLLENVVTQIRSSAYVVAKVDSTSRNVYFEIGLAQALDKELLLVAHNKFRMPTDLRGMMLLTYTAGDYAELKEKIAAHFETKYELIRATVA